jgi:hypothetical protein
MTKLVSILVLILVLASCSYQTNQQLQAENKGLRERVGELEKQQKVKTSEEMRGVPEKDYVEKACDLWVMLRSNPDKYLRQDFTLELKVDYMNSGRGYFSSYPGSIRYYNDKYSKTLPAGIWPQGVQFAVDTRYSKRGVVGEFSKIKENDRVKITAEFFRLADDGAVLMYGIKELVNEGWKPEN